MRMMTSAYANKMLKSLEEDKSYWVNKEAASMTYVVAINEEPVIPEYDYTEVATTIANLDEKIAIIKHALNVSNANAKVYVGDSLMSIDTILIISNHFTNADIRAAPCTFILVSNKSVDKILVSSFNIKCQTISSGIGIIIKYWQRFSNFT